MARGLKKLGHLLLSRMVITALLVLGQVVFLFFEIYQLSSYYVYIDTVLRIISIGVVIFLLYRPSNPSVKISWIIFIMLLPVLGGLVYVLFGHVFLGKKMGNAIKRAAESTRESFPAQSDVLHEIASEDKSVSNLCGYIEEYSFTPVCKNTKTTYYPVGEEYWKAMLDDLEKAERFIFVEYFIIEEGEMWDAVHDILRRKAANGVEVRVMYDDVGSVFVLPNHYDEKLEREGIKSVAFNKLFPLIAIILNHRDHRKIVSIDGRVAYTGGINMADEYINRKVKFGHWKDTGVRVEGEAAKGFTVMFLQMWNAMKPTETDFAPYCVPFEKDAYQDGYVQPYGDTPLDEETLGENIYKNIINNAKDYVWIYTPYLIVDDAMLQSLCLAAKRGVDVRIVTPGIPDKKVAYWLTQSNYSVLLQAGVKILQYTPGFIHAKCVLCDDRIATVGTVNMDYRSFFHHFECGALFYQTSVSKSLKMDMLKTFEMSEEITPAWLKEHVATNLLFGPILKLLAPLF